MKTTIKLAVATALVAAATSANAGIVIPAGDWTLDIGGVVTLTTRTHHSVAMKTLLQLDQGARVELVQGNSVTVIA